MVPASTKAGITGHGFQTQRLPAATLLKSLANRNGLHLVRVQPTHRMNYQPMSEVATTHHVSQGQRRDSGFDMGSEGSNPIPAN